ncbi:MAG: HEAT repeat domain-containing protein [Bryobacterales bacterium]
MEDLTELIKTVKAYDWDQSGAPLLAIDAEIRKLLGHPDHLAKLEEALLGALQSNASLAAKRGVCKRLGLIASERSVPTLAAMLVDTETSDMARYSLEQIPSGAVETALRQALAKTKGLTRVGIVNSIGNRNDSRAAAALGQLLDDTDQAAAEAAAWALGRIGGPEAVRLLAARKGAAPNPLRAEILDAYLVCAGRLASEGNKAQAQAMYKELNAEGMPRPIRRAAELGLKAAES